MPTLIRQALFERIRRLPALRECLSHVSLATGVAVHFAGPMGQSGDGDAPIPVCRVACVADGDPGRCARRLQRTLARAMDGPVHDVCACGGRLSAVPVRAGGQILGFFVFGGDPGLSRTTERESALGGLLELVATQLALMVTDTLAHPEKPLPEIINRACTLARRQFHEPLSLATVAADLSVSTAHLSRLFHHSTGLPFREYLTRLRTEHAKKLLLTTGRNVTEIAYASGFQSISQFNRAFKAVHGLSPRTLRERGNGPAKTGADAPRKKTAQACGARQTSVTGGSPGRINPVPGTVAH